jgi:hypothetical protein
MTEGLWNVRPHGSISAVDDAILTVVGELRMPLATLPRRMTIVRLRDSRLVVWSAIALDAPGMAVIEAFGKPAFLAVPNAHHRLDAAAWRKRYPAMQVIAPAGARTEVEKVVPVDTTAPNFGDPDVQFMTVPGTREREAVLVATGSRGTTLVLNDLVGNIGPEGGWVLRVAGFAGRPQIPRVVRWVLVDDKRALREQLLRWAEIESLARILVSHGEPIAGDPRRTLRELADSLA